MSERQAGGGQGLGNPHGEHGETVYDLTELEISEGVTLVVEGATQACVVRRNRSPTC